VTPASVREQVRASRMQQGLPDRITDPATLAALAAVVAEVLARAKDGADATL
jgi:peptidoglycan hydrolase-like protein with peptidoglycan-binding domain